MAATLNQLLKEMTDQGASDLHITTNSPPQIRIDGVLHALNHPQLTPTETKKLCYSILTDYQKQTFEETKELDLSFGIKGLSRFRGNVFVSKGAVAGAFRTIPYEIPTFEALGMPPEARPETNIVIFRVSNDGDFRRAAAKRGVLLSGSGPGRVRAVTHLDVSAADIDEAVDRLKPIVESH